MRKYTRTEEPPSVISTRAHKAVQEVLAKLSKTSARDLSVSQRQKVVTAIDDTDEEC